MRTSKYQFKDEKQSKIKVMIVDDHTLVLEGLRSLLVTNQDIDVVASFTTGEEALAFLSSSTVDIVLLDINLSDTSGIDVCHTIFQKYHNIKVIGLSTYNDRSIINQMITNGAKGYLLKNVNSDELIKAITTVYQNGNYYGIEIQKTMANTIFSTLDDTPRLTKREKQIITHIAEGKTTNQIAEELFISPLTVETHRRNIMKKMNVSNVASLIKIAIEKMLI
ncbi:response regulator transcription factor [Aquimarina algicola]|uniref:Response regulator transcription factor n=1 Tax=Aquimarina algicola TaxID=2589995 RepID=A0A504IZP0_9FLAO|nr:response regulator transcription factor [Aquimarina algicola]TPN81228.1 response regulator transcription factor [Aquimarina algicola]